MKKKKIGFAFNQGEIELLIDALEEFMENAPDAWVEPPMLLKVLNTLKSDSEFYKNK